ncbi:MAG: formimidoylglutamate deiminase [Myxococcales bacterium]|nr:formimidoylglutamate deiminase [Myxococcales bacterium]
MAKLYQPELVFRGGRFEAAPLSVSDEGTVAAEAPPSAEVVRLPGRALLPGLVNAHSHAFQRLLRGRTEFVAQGRASDDFWSWREAMYLIAERLGPEELYQASRQAFLEMALSGITSVGEFHYLHHGPGGRPYQDRHELSKQVIRAAREVGLRVALLRGGYQRAGFGSPPNPRQARFIDSDVEAFLRSAEELRQATRADPLVTVGLAPHSVRALSRRWLEQVARSPGLVHLHAAEQLAEVDACLTEHRLRPVELLDSVGLLRHGTTLVHAIHLSHRELSALGRSGVSVCACPSTERNLGDGIVPADLLVASGVHIALGTDSQVGIDLFEDARELESHLRLICGKRGVLDPGGGEPAGLAARLLAFATREGAHCLALPTGELSPGAPADFFTVDLSHPSIAGAHGEALLPAIVFSAEKAAVREVAVQGRLVVREGRHPLQEEVVRDFSALGRRVFA